MSTYATVQRERACTNLAPSHCAPPEVAETVSDHGLTYLVLRCQACGRPQGLRLVRKSRS